MRKPYYNKAKRLETNKTKTGRTDLKRICLLPCCGDPAHRRRRPAHEPLRPRRDGRRRRRSRGPAGSSHSGPPPGCSPRATGQLETLPIISGNVALRINRDNGSV
jgi:hypothetical protein